MNEMRGTKHRTMRMQPRGDSCPWCGAPGVTSTCPWSLVCPVCAAAPGERCRRPSGEEASLHRSRVRLASALVPLLLVDPLPGEEGQMSIAGAAT